MYQMPYVIITFDVDCDGTSYAAHRVYAPRDRDMTDGELHAHAIATEQMSGYAELGEAMTMAEFRQSPDWHGLDEWSRDYFQREGYASLHTDWRPWAFDDTIGIPAFYPED